MRIIALGDIHGRSVWKSIVKHEAFDKIVFIGDFFDSKESISASSQKKNFKEIIQFKKSNPEKVVLLIGNHDYHYLRYVYQTYSGFQAFDHPLIQELLEEAFSEGLLQVSYVWKNFAFTHAGITKFWYKLFFGKEFTDDASLEAALNERFKTNRLDFGFQHGPNCDPKGDNHYQSPLWVRPNSLLVDKIEAFTHIVGHTIKDRLTYSEGDGVVFIDTLGTSVEYPVIDDSLVIPTLNKF